MCDGECVFGVGGLVVVFVCVCGVEGVFVLLWGLWGLVSFSERFEVVF